MATSRWVYRLRDGKFLHGGFHDPHYDPEVEGCVSFPDSEPHPDRRLHRANCAGATNFDPEKSLGLRVPASEEEIAAFEAEDPHSLREAAAARLRAKKAAIGPGVALGPPTREEFNDLLIYLGIQ